MFISLQIDGRKLPICDVSGSKWILKMPRGKFKCKVTIVPRSKMGNFISMDMVDVMSESFPTKSCF